MFLENYKKFIIYYGKGRYLKLLGFSGLFLCAGILELTGVALIYPFTILIMNPNSIGKYLPNLRLENPILTGLLIGLCVLLIFIGKNLFMILVQYIQNKFICNWKKDIAEKFMEYYLYAPYKAILSSSQSDKIYDIETLCSVAIDGFVMRGLNLITNIIITAMIIGLLFIKFPIPALGTVIFVTVTMYLQNKYFKKRSNTLASTMEKINKKHNDTILENISNIKELKILSAEDTFFEKYQIVEKSYRKTQELQSFYNAIPPYLVEMLVVLALLILACIISIQSPNDNSKLMASFAIIVASIFRIAPALNRIQSSIININASRNFVKRINEKYEKYDFDHFKKENLQSEGILGFHDKIELKNICFSYNSNKQVLKNISITINKGDFVGIIGLSGAGKSTLANILTGLLPADSGEIIVDNTELSQKNFQKFRRMLGYVPQQINILDKSIKENVAWGCKEINDSKVVNALKSAQLYNVIEEYPQGIDSNIIVSSNGLSQGQKQRLAIARALYRDPQIIILDEATSALDVQIEHEITEMLKEISSTKTIIAIAHRLSTLKACNKLIYMKNGTIVDVGTFAGLSEKYEEFENLIKLSSIK